MMKRKTFSRTVFISDVHIPYEDKKALTLAFDIIKDYKLNSNDTIILGGDLLDYYPLSSFNPDLHNSSIDIELFEGQQFLNKLRKIAPKCNIVFFEGNHEQRMQKKIMSHCSALAPFLKNKLTIKELLEFRKFDIRERKTPYTKNKKLYYMHGHEKRGFITPKHIAHVHLNYTNRNIIVGHHHRFDMFITTQMDGSLLGGWCNGCLCDLSQMPDGLYTAFDSSQRGITVVYEKTNGLFNVVQHLFIPNKKNGYDCLVNGTDYVSN
jgi:UDP-2,3-diacylglucosamine pyrophosphatase LpxH